MIRLPALAALCIALPSVANAAAQVATGCLTRSGDIINVAIGNQPKRPCRSNQSEITVSLGVHDHEEAEGIDTVSFFFEMAGGEERSILTIGSTEIFARCQIDVTFRGSNQDVMSIIATS
jgi:hypothetical protein